MHCTTACTRDELKPRWRACEWKHVWVSQRPVRPALVYSNAAIRFRMVSADGVRARYRASDSVSASKP